MHEVEISSRIKSEIFGKRIRLYDVIDSTNLRALDLIREGEEEGTLVIAEEQTAGRGRRGNVWFSERGKNLLFSLIIKPRISRDSFGLISLTAALSVAKAVQTLYKFSPECKWPNDVMSDGRKFCGILPEGVMRGREFLGISLGIGINVNQINFPSEIAEKSMALSLLAGKELDRFELLAEILLHLEKNFRKLGEGHEAEILDEWKSFSSQLERKVSINVDGKIFKGIVEDVTKDGSLIIRDKEKKLKILAGDVSYDTRI
jgi:BirA family transcriptional regulator, biotin operon repressor / biotin---[acetyl-CoA-carboxylase] ligase